MSALLAAVNEELAPLAVEETVGSYSTEYRITGTLQAVFMAIEQRFGAYHPMGYGTRVHHIEMIPSGMYCARMSRSNSCD